MEEHKFSAQIEQYQGDKVDPESVYGVQIKRLHEYRGQQLNLLWAIGRYLHIKDGYRLRRLVTAFLGAKAAPAYVIAKDIVHMILAFSSIINNDPEVGPYLKIVMLRNYNVSIAGKLIPASNISEQVSLASKEASGTGNMKFMLNDAVTLGTMGGADVEIAEPVGEDSIFTLGQSPEEVIEHYKNADHVAKNWYKKDKRFTAVMDFLVGEKMLKTGDRKLLKQLHDELLGKDWLITFPDFESYCKAKDKALAVYEDRMGWVKKMVVNIAKAGYFSSDGTIDQYNNDIWHLEKDC